MTSRSNRWKLVLLAATATLGLAAGCHKKPTNTVGTGLDNAPASSSEPAPTATIAADPLAIDLGQSVVLNWRTTNATSVTIDGIGHVPINGTQTVSPANSTNFHLVAKGDGGTVEANVRVTVRVPTVPTVADLPNTGQSNIDNGEHGHRRRLPRRTSRTSSSTTTASTSAPTPQPPSLNAARYLDAHPAIKVLIGGYCDDRGSAEYNITLGENRANAARTALVSAGVSATRIRVISYGKERQFCTEENETCWQENRRAQFTSTAKPCEWSSCDFDLTQP